MNILVTGTTRGIGMDIYSFLSKSHTVYTVNRRPTSNSNNYLCDLSDIGQVMALCDQIRAKHWDVLINNAGGAECGRFDELDVEAITKCMNLNFTAPVLLMQSVLVGMKERRYGRVINISSITGKTPALFLPIYSAAKSALCSITSGCARQYQNCNVLLNSLCLGAVETETSNAGRRSISLLHGLPEDRYQQNMLDSTSLGRLIGSQEIAGWIEILLSHAGDIITGQNINICGALEIH